MHTVLGFIGTHSSEFHSWFRANKLGMLKEYGRTDGSWWGVLGSLRAGLCGWIQRMYAAANRTEQSRAFQQGTDPKGAAANRTEQSRAFQQGIDPKGAEVWDGGYWDSASPSLAPLDKKFLCIRLCKLNHDFVPWPRTDELMDDATVVGCNCH